MHERERENKIEKREKEREGERAPKFPDKADHDIPAREIEKKSA